MVNNTKSIFSNSLLGLIIIGDEMFVFRGKNNLTPFIVKKSANRCKTYPIMNPEYTRDKLYFTVANLTIYETARKPIMLWVKPLWLDSPMNRVTMPKRPNILFSVRKYK